MLKITFKSEAASFAFLVGHSRLLLACAMVILALALGFDTFLQSRCCQVCVNLIPKALQYVAYKQSCRNTRSS